MKDKMEILAHIHCFNGLNSESLSAVERITVEKNYGRGETIFHDGEAADGFYVVASGQVKIYKVSSEGKEQIFHIFGPGEPFGEVPMFSGDVFPANAQAIAKTRLIYLPRKAFVRLITADPSLSLAMLAVLSQRLRSFTVQIENLSLKEVPGRLADYLIYLSKEQGREDSVELPISKGQLASLLGTIPETLSRIFARMSSDSLIEVRARRIVLADMEGLHTLAEFGPSRNG